MSKNHNQTGHTWKDLSGETGDIIDPSLQQSTFELLCTKCFVRVHKLGRIEVLLRGGFVEKRPALSCDEEIVNMIHES